MNSVGRSLNGCFVRVFAFAERMFAFCSRWLVGLNGCSHSLNGCFVQEDVQAERMFVFAERCLVPVLAVRRYKKSVTMVGNIEAVVELPYCFFLQELKLEIMN